MNNEALDNKIIDNDIESQLFIKKKSRCDQIQTQTQTQTQNQIREAENSDEWTNEIVELIKRWKDQIEKLSHVHQESGYIDKVRYYRLTIPSILLPFIMTLVSQNLYEGKNDTAHIIDGVAFAVTSILSALSMFFNYNQGSEKHFQTSARYTDLGNRIDSELARRPQFRTPSDVFITELKGSIEALNNCSPDLPGNWC